MSKTSDFRITLDGSRGLVSNVSQHSGERGTYVVFRDVITDIANRIVKRDGKGATLGSVAGTEIQTIHEYVYTDPTTGATSNHVLGAIDGSSYIYATVNSGATWTGQTLPITPTAGGRWFFCNADNRVFAVNGKDAMLVAIQTSANTLTWRKAGQAAPTAVATYSLITNDPPYNTGTISCTNGLATCAGIGTTWVTGAAWVGKRITINGVPYTILSVSSTTALTLTETFRETTGTYAYNVFRGVGDWITPPRYCYAYRNPTTGHLSNVSPVLEITEQNQFGRTLAVTIPGPGVASGENFNAYQNGYTQIQMFRSAKNAYTLVAINEFLPNNNTGAAITYVETAAKFSDTYLTDLLAPFDQNGVPPVGIPCIAFHQDRMWALSVDGRLRFTPAPFELSYGVAAEAWPSLPQFSRRVPEASGLLIVGATSTSEAIVIQTAKGDKSVDGFNPLNFNVFGMRTRRSGGFLYSAVDLDGSLVEFYRDKRLMSYPGGVDVGIAIQNKLSTVRTSLLSGVRLHWFAAEARNLLLLSAPATGASTTNDVTYVFDLDKGALVTEWNAGFSAFASIHDRTTGELQLLAGDSTGAVYRLLSGNNQDAGANFAPVIKTAIIRPLESEAWSDIGSVEIYVNDVTGSWTGRLFIHEQTNTGATDGTVTPLTFVAAPYKSQSAQGKRMVATFSHSKRTVSEAFQIEITFPTQNLALWIEKIVVRFKAKTERTR